jgi:hypothetical protein
LSRIVVPPALLALLISACDEGGTPGSMAPPMDARASTPVDAAVGADSGPAADTSGGDGAPGSTCTPAGSVLCNPLLPLPRSLRETGFFPVLSNLDVLPANAHAFVPAFQLWSDGLHKLRQVILPAGQKIDIARREAWVFPTGTIFLKTFLADGPGGMKPVETRVIRRTDNPDPFEQYRFDVYRWNDAATDATLLDIQERTAAPVTVAGRSHTHQIPSRDDCKKCHAANDTNVIGFDEVRLNFASVPGSKTQLETFASLGYFKQTLPASPAQISDPDPLTQQVKRYLYGNCYHCHNGNDTQAFDMHPDGLVMAVVRQPTMGSGTAPGIRVVPGNPEMSVLYRQLTRMNLAMGYNPMPPVGVQLADADALRVVRDWILALK